MPHAIKESHLEELCASCKKPRGNNVELLHQHHKLYSKITCENCGYVAITVQNEKEFTNRYEYM